MLLAHGAHFEQQGPTYGCDDSELTAARLGSKVTSHNWHLESVEETHWTIYTER